MSSEKACFISIRHLPFSQDFFFYDSNSDILKIKEISILCRQKSKNIRMLLLLKMFWLELFILFVEILSGRYFYCLKVFLAEKSNHQIFLINKPEKRPGKCWVIKIDCRQIEKIPNKLIAFPSFLFFGLKMPKKAGTS